jgi:hypothetical protein
LTAHDDNVDIARLHVAHPRIRAADWRSPLVRRLLNKQPYRDGSKLIGDSFRCPEGTESENQLSLTWSGLEEDVALTDNTYQEPVITEFATLGLACILTSRRTGLQITEVTRRGERVDYWLGDKEYVLEVSGTQSGSLEKLYETKAQQLSENPFEKSGYVCVAEYKGLRARLWYCGAKP